MKCEVYGQRTDALTAVVVGLVLCLSSPDRVMSEVVTRSDGLLGGGADTGGGGGGGRLSAPDRTAVTGLVWSVREWFDGR